MVNPVFTTLMDSLNAQIEALNKSGFKLYDAENRDYFIERIKYDGENIVNIYKLISVIWYNC
ncbi:hypothetical protein [Clostridium kluyveri]|uniref:Uncharacterized protein n=1 Tax=Clostridium kluyveri (strain NBRC 12016) TaxID=583346 RepID=B9E550_CLOK1|nr:hypothetical protein [Clostridium kluyveri]BAH07625.1 hypothetical protein CKR_2574 [Clostridium kluyveri NBRC 12016]